MVESIQVDRIVNNNSLICSLESSILCPEQVIAATRDGKIKSFNVMNGNMDRVYTVNENSIIELVVVER